MPSSDAPPISKEPADEGEEDSGESTPICICCLAPLESDESLFCPDCGAPVDAVAAIMPFERIQAEGFVFRRAVSQPTHWLVPAGIWAMGAPQVVAITILLLSPEESNPEGGEWGMRAALLFYDLVLIVLITRVTRSFWRHRRKKVSDEARGA